MCAALAVAALAGCGGGDDEASGGASAAPEAREEAPPSVGGGAAQPRPDALSRRLSRTCRRVQARLPRLPEPEGDLAVVASNARAEQKVLRTLARRLSGVPVDDDRRAALQAYRRALAREVAVDRLVAVAAQARDRAAVRALVGQNESNRKVRDRQWAALQASGCRPRERVTD